MIEEFIKRYGRYMGGIDYEKILNELRNEDRELKVREELILGTELSSESEYRGFREMIERKQLMLKYAMLKNEESRLLGLIEELKIRGYTVTEINKARARLRRVRKELRLIKKLLRDLNEKA